MSSNLRSRLAAGLALSVLALAVAVVTGPPPAAAAPPPTSSFEKVKLDGGLSMGEPIELSVLPDGKVLYINRGTSSGGGQVRLYNPATRQTTVALTLQLDARHEDGLIGITPHPRFATNRWVYLFYSPAVTPLVNRISGSPSTTPRWCSTRPVRGRSSSGRPNGGCAATRPVR